MIYENDIFEELTAKWDDLLVMHVETNTTRIITPSSTITPRAGKKYSNLQTRFTKNIFLICCLLTNYIKRNYDNILSKIPIFTSISEIFFNFGNFLKTPLS